MSGSLAVHAREWADLEDRVAALRATLGGARGRIFVGRQAWEDLAGGAPRLPEEALGGAGIRFALWVSSGMACAVGADGKVYSAPLPDRKQEHDQAPEEPLPVSHHSGSIGGERVQEEGEQ